MDEQINVKAEVMGIVKQIRDAWTQWPLKVEAENRQLGENDKAMPYLKVKVDFMDSEQVELGSGPVQVKEVGQILLSVVSKCGTGTADSDQLAAFIKPYFDRRILTTLRTHPVAPAGAREIKGEYYTNLLVDFWYHRLSAA